MASATYIATQGQSHAVDVSGPSEEHKEEKKTETPAGEEGVMGQLSGGGGGDDLDAGVSSLGGGLTPADRYAGVEALIRSPEGHGGVAPSLTGNRDDTTGSDGPDSEEKNDQVEDQSEVGEVVHIWTPC